MGTTQSYCLTHESFSLLSGSEATICSPNIHGCSCSLSTSQIGRLKHITDTTYLENTVSPVNPSTASTSVRKSTPGKRLHTSAKLRSMIFMQKRDFHMKNLFVVRTPIPPSITPRTIRHRGLETEQLSALTCPNSRTYGAHGASTIDLQSISLRESDHSLFTVFWFL